MYIARDTIVIQVSLPLSVPPLPRSDTLKDTNSVPRANLQAEEPTPWHKL